jgi:hypothetical protein
MVVRVSVARESKTRRRRKKIRRVRNRLWEIYRHAWFKASAGPFRRRHLVGLSFRNISVGFNFDRETPVPTAALDPERPDESLAEIHDAIEAAEQATTGRGRA